MVLRLIFLSDGDDLAGGAVADADEVDAAIAELKDKILQKDFFWEGCGFAKMGFKNTIAVYEYLDKLNAEKRMLKRALWLARAERALAERRRYCAMAAFEDIENDALRIKWYKIQHKCLAKAEEYK